MAIGEYSLSSATTAAGRVSSGTAAARHAAMREISAALPRFRLGLVPGDTGAQAARVARAWAAKKREEQARDAAEIAQELQTGIGESSLALYGRQGLAADGVQDAFKEQANDAVSKRLREVDPETAKLVQDRLAPWLAGRYENFARFGASEVRKGQRLKLETDMAGFGQSEAMDIVAQARASDADTDRLKENVDAYYAQFAATTEESAKRLGQAVQGGIISQEEADARAAKLRRDNASNLVSALIEGGAVNTAEALIERWTKGKARQDAQKPQEEPSPTSPTSPTSPPEGRQTTVAARLGLGADEIERFRTQIASQRRRAEAEKRQEEAERHRLADEEFQKKEIAVHTAPVPSDAKGLEAYLAKQAAWYAKMSTDTSLSPQRRNMCAKTAERLGFGAEDAKDRQAREARAAYNEAKAERKEQAAYEEKLAKQREQALKESQKETYELSKLAFEARGEWTPDGQFRDMTAAEMRETAHALLADGKISKLQFLSLMQVGEQSRTDEANAFRDLVLADTPKLFRNVGKWSKGRFGFTTNDKRNVASPSGRQTALGEAVSCGQYMKAMNQTIAWMQQTNASVEQAKQHFDNLTKGIVAGQQKASMDAALEADENLVKEWGRNLNGY